MGYFPAPMSSYFFQWYFFWLICVYYCLLFSKDGSYIDEMIELISNKILKLNVEDSLNGFLGVLFDNKGQFQYHWAKAKWPIGYNIDGHGTR